MQKESLSPWYWGTDNTGFGILVEHGGQERQQQEFESLFEQAGLKLVRLIEIDSSFYIMEVQRYA